MVQLEPLCGPSVNYSHIFLLNWQTLKTTKRGLRLQSTLQRGTSALAWGRAGGALMQRYSWRRSTAPPLFAHPTSRL